MDTESASASLTGHKNPTQFWERTLLMADAGMVFALFGNFSLIVMDALYLWAPSALGWQFIWGDSYQYYGTHIHPYFGLIDAGFIGFFLIEFTLRWGLSVFQKEWPHWYAFPIIHWYDLLGCIPLGPFRALRFLRIIGIILRLQRMKLIDFKRWRIYRFVMLIYGIIMEEISDRVVIKVIDGVQAELKTHSNLQDELFNTVILPRQTRLTKALADTLEQTIYDLHSRYEKPLEELIRNLVHDAIAHNRELGRIEMIPMLGDFISKSIEHAIHDITAQVIKGGVHRLQDGQAEALISDIIATVGRSLKLTQGEMSHELTALLDDVLRVVKDKVAERQWLKPKSTNG